MKNFVTTSIILWTIVAILTSPFWMDRIIFKKSNKEKTISQTVKVAPPITDEEREKLIRLNSRLITEREEIEEKKNESISTTKSKDKYIPYDLADDIEIEKKLKEQRKAEAFELNELRKKMTSKVDEIEGIKWIYDKTTRKMLDNRGRRKNLFYVYLGQSTQTNHMWPRFYMGFIRDGWIFFDEVIINIDGATRNLSFGRFNVKRDVLGGSTIIEYIDISADDYEQLIKSIANSKKTMVRFKGDQYSHDFTMSKEQKTALKNIWRLYELMR